MLIILLQLVVDCLELSFEHICLVHVKLWLLLLLLLFLFVVLLVDIRLDGLGRRLVYLELLHLDLSRLLGTFVLELLLPRCFAWNLNVEDHRSETGHGCYHVLVHQVGRVKYNRSGGPLGQRPEQIAFFGLGVQRVDVQELLDVVTEELLKLLSSELNAILERLWSLLQHLDAFTESHDVLLGSWIEVSANLKDLEQILWSLSKELAK